MTRCSSSKCRNVANIIYIFCCRLLDDYIPW